ncbi:MAG TPA: IS200/IS605 family transposase [Verrucomicrobiae bacterium]|nr:IS200/IS605 family transposase [Verrucomicrobiae bacterium]
MDVTARKLRVDRGALSRRDIPTIARRFNAGGQNCVAQVPKGRLNATRVLREFISPCVFSTKDRQPLITAALRERLWPFLGGIARNNKMKAIEIGGVEDHVHLLLSIPSTVSIAKALQLIKGGSSKWVHETFPEYRLFEWQEKYGAFSVSVSQLDNIIEYIKNQQEHHRKMTFQEEFLALLKKHRVEFDEAYLWV